MERLERNLEATQQWIDETQKRGGSVNKFITEHYKKINVSGQGVDKGAKSYDPYVEFHSSGSNHELFSKIKSGELEPDRVNVYYEGDEIKQIHAVYYSEGQGHNIDIYISGKALEDYSNENEK